MTGSPLYEVGILAAALDERVDELASALTTLLQQTIGDSAFATLAIKPVGELDLASPAVVAVLWDATLTAQDLAVLEPAIAADITILPVVHSTDTMPELPSVLSIRNAIGWDKGPVAVARTCLRELRLFESTRSVFISHRRSDGLIAAERLYEAFSKAGWRPFVDRFGIEGGALFQERIDEALEECAFLLLVETPDASSSDWVLHEVLYALEHSLGLTIVNIGNAPHFPSTEGLPRTVLNHDFGMNGSHIVLSDAAVEEIVELVEAQHAAALVRRRRQLLVSAGASARKSGREVVPAVGWRLRVTQPSGPDEIVGVLPHLPGSDDLYEIAEGASEAELVVLVHAAHTLGDRREAMLRWLIGERPIELVPNNSIGARWAKLS